MPQQTQIVPQYEQPYSLTVINDNTTFVEDIERNEFNGTTTVYVTTADKGPTNRFIDILSGSELNEVFGLPNMRTHGQPLYNANAYFGNENTRAFTMRVAADDATIANSIVVAKVKVTPGTPANDPDPAVPGSLSVRLETLQVADLQSKTDIPGELAALRSDTPDVEGYLQFPLFALSALGAGKSGNDIRVRLVKDPLTDGDNVYINYHLDVCEIEGTLLIKRALTGSLFDGAIEDGMGIFLEDVVEDDESPLQKISLLVDSDSLEDLYDLYIETVDPVDPIPMYAFDYLYGLQRINSNPIPGYTIEPAQLDDFTLDSTEGVALTGGSDGLLDPAVLDAYNAANVGAEKTMDEVRDELFMKAFRGEIDPLIKSRKRVPIDFLTDANYSAEVKESMVDLFDLRRDFQLFLDAGILETYSEASLWSLEQADKAHHYGINREFQHYKIRDPYTNKKIAVTTMHYLNEQFPDIFLNDISKPLAGAENATLTSHVKDSLLPSIDDDDLDLKERFYKRHITYYTCYGENLYMRSTQETSQEARSDLSEQNNVRMLYNMKRVMEGYASRNSYDFTTVEDREDLNRRGQVYVRTYMPDHVESFSISFRANAWEQKRSINHSYIEVVFKGLNKRTIIEIDVNPRTAQV